jgi:hypothetical protein
MNIIWDIPIHIKNLCRAQCNVKNTTFGILFVVIVVSLLNVITGLAQANVGLRVCPSKIVFKTPPGFSETKVIKISNCGSGDALVNADVVENPNPRKTADSQGKVQSDLVEKWLKITPKTFKLKPNTARFVRVVMIIPAGRQLGKCDCAIKFDASSSGSKINVVGSVASSIILDQQDKPGVDFKVEEFSVGGLNVGSPVEFNLSVNNLGKVDYRTSGKIEVRTLNGKQVSEFSLPKINTQPDSKHEIKIKTKNVLPIGVYQCSLMMADGNFYKETIEEQLIVFPWVGVSGIAVILFGFYALVKNIGKRIAG